jgi:general stress protein YciG
MAGTKAGGKLAAQKNLKRDPLFYAKIGAKGGANGRTGGFAANPELARIAGAKGGRISRRKKADTATATVPVDASSITSDDVTLAA